ncbi:hypothetical protein DFH06DRAFT_1243914 [Mycena polygramma]|nr:hypothetical protein DFH06DRAFT_1243914 [Mycena polygramma]
MAQIQCCWKCGASATGLDASLASSEPQQDSSPHLACLLKSNDVPLDRDIPHILDSIADAQNRVASFDTQIETLKGALAQLVLNREARVKSIHQYRGILSPLRRLPSELLCEIFAITVSSERAAQNTDSSMRSPWYLSAVCRFWRTSALEYAPLWSFITVPMLAPTSQCLSLLNSLETQLLRSGRVPLDVRCRACLNPQMLDPVLAEFERWSVLRLRMELISSTSGTLQWLSSVKDRLSILETLETIGDSVAIPDVFSTAPSLRKAILSDAKFMYRSPTIALPWGQITHYRGTYDLLRHCHILMTAPNLLECTVHISLGRFGNGSPGTPNASNHATLPHLRRLAVTGATFLPYLTAPLVEDMFLMYTWSVHLPALLDFLQRAPCITRLTLLQCAMMAELPTILPVLPALEYLCIEPETYPDDASDQNVLFEALAIAHSATDVCINLATLLYGVGPKFAEDRFFAMARSRFEASCLAELRLFNCGYINLCPLDVLAGLQKLADEGFDAAFIQSSSPRLVKAKNDFF